MSARKSERIMNLTICLLMARRFLPRESIREAVEGYHGLSDAAFERTFERDKEELRAMGVPVETGSDSVLFPDEVGYRIRRADFELPPLEFSAGETVALGLASTVWDQARVADDMVRAVAKLRAAGVEPDADRAAHLAPSLAAHEAAFELLWQATNSRTRVRFTYKGVERVVEPWFLANRRGAWYLLAFDTTRSDRRLYKVARVEGEATVVGEAQAYAVPEIDLEAAFAALEARPADLWAVVAIADGRAPDLRRRAEPIDGVAPAGRSLFRLPYSEERDPVGELAAHGADVLVLEPAALRAAVARHLRGVVGLEAS